MSRPWRLPAPGNEAEWTKFNEEEQREEAEFAASLSMDERLVAQQRISELRGARQSAVPLATDAGEDSVLVGTQRTERSDESPPSSGHLRPLRGRCG